MQQEQMGMPVTSQEVPQQASTQQYNFHAVVDVAIAFICLLALILIIVLWAVATAFPVLTTVLALTITLLMASVGIILIVRYIDIAMFNWKTFYDFLFSLYTFIN